MSVPGSSFTQSIPQHYHDLLGPILFEPYANDLVRRLAIKGTEKILETAAGTGIVTKKVAPLLINGGHLTATDLNADMLAIIDSEDSGHVKFMVADALDLPFGNAEFDLAFTQFGLMLFPDQVKALQEIRRVTKPGSRYLYSVWDTMARNEIFSIGDRVCRAAFPDDPPGFYTVPCGYNDRDRMAADLLAAGYEKFNIETVELNSGEFAVEQIARGLILGTPMSVAIKDRNGDLEAVAELLKQAFQSTSGTAKMEVKLSVLVTEAIT